MDGKRVWDCKIGYAGEDELPPGADGPMRDAIRKAFVELTGHEPQFIFSGWGGELTEAELHVAENVLNRPERVIKTFENVVAPSPLLEDLQFLPIPETATTTVPSLRERFARFLERRESGDKKP